MQSFFIQKKTLIIELVILVAFLAGAYYLYTSFTQGDTITLAAPQYNEKLLGQNLILVSKAMNQDGLSFKEISFLNGKLVSRLFNNTETIDINPTRGREDPFTPYAPTRSIR